MNLNIRQKWGITIGIIGGLIACVSDIPTLSDKIRAACLIGAVVLLLCGFLLFVLSNEREPASDGQ